MCKINNLECGFGVVLVNMAFLNSGFSYFHITNVRIHLKYIFTVESLYC